MEKRNRRLLSLVITVFFIGLSSAISAKKVSRSVSISKPPKIVIDKAGGKVSGLDKHITVEVKRKDKRTIKKKCKSIEVWIEKVNKKAKYLVGPDTKKLNLANFSKKINIPMWKFAVEQFWLQVDRKKYDPKYGKYIDYKEMAKNKTEARDALLKLNPQPVKAKFKIRVTYEFGGAGATGRKKYTHEYKSVEVDFVRKGS